MGHCIKQPDCSQDTLAAVCPPPDTGRQGCGEILLLLSHQGLGECLPTLLKAPVHLWGWQLWDRTVMAPESPRKD